MVIQNVTTSFSVVEGFTTNVPLFFFVVGMTVYSIFVFKFYKFLARKDILELHFHKRDATMTVFFKVIFYILEYIILIPFLIFFWFGVLTFILTFLAKTQDVGNILLVSMALVAAVRVAAYYNEDLSTDLAKMLPFALLGVFLLDISSFSLESSIDMIMALKYKLTTFVYYFVFVVCLEFILRVIYIVAHPERAAKEDDD